jgi:hypothetical protein
MVLMKAGRGQPLPRRSPGLRHEVIESLVDLAPFLLHSFQLGPPVLSLAAVKYIHLLGEMSDRTPPEVTRPDPPPVADRLIIVS